MNPPLLRWIAAALLAAVALPLPAAEPARPAFKPHDLRCDYLVNPLGIDDLQPALSWKLASGIAGRRGLSQSAYQLLVASRPALMAEMRADLWDSGRVASSQSLHVAYQGKPLAARTQCWWKVRFWDDAGQASDWSEPAFWSMGLLKPDDWQGAKWIGLDRGEQHEPLDISDLAAAKWLWFPEGNGAIDAPTETRFFRRSFLLPADRQVRRAVAMFAADDHCTFAVNGVQAGIGHGHPNLVAAEITAQLRPGVNLLTAEVANLPAPVVQNPGGWIGLVRIDFQDGPPLIIATDQSWKCAKTAGEGWRQTSFNDRDWTTAQELGPLGMPPWGTPWKEADFAGDHRRLPARYLRRPFQVDQGQAVRRATAYVSGLGFFDLYVNGQLIGDQLMNPALTGYDRHGNRI